MKVQEVKDYEELMKRIKKYPSFVEEYVSYKLTESVSPSSLLEYSRDFDRFYSWLVLHKAMDEKSVFQIEYVNQLTVNDIHQYMDYLREQEMMKERSVSRKIHSLRSLFNYLHDVAENLEGEPLLSRNIFRKISMQRLTDVQATAREINEKVLISNEVHDFIDFVRSGYRSKLADNVQALWNYDLNQQRDMCIISLLLHSGLLVSDIVNLDVADLSLSQNQILITRQRSRQRTNHIVMFGEIAKADINKYLNIRNIVYKPQTNETALFLAVPNGQLTGSRMTKRAIQAMVLKYAQHFGRP